jgi:hypothetical protein
LSAVTGKARRVMRRHILLLSALVVVVMALPAGAQAASWHGPYGTNVGPGQTWLTTSTVAGANMSSADSNMCLGNPGWNCSPFWNNVEWVWANIGSGPVQVWNANPYTVHINYWLNY